MLGNIPPDPVLCSLQEQVLPRETVTQTVWAEVLGAWAVAGEAACGRVDIWRLTYTDCRLPLLQRSHPSTSTLCQSGGRRNGACSSPTSAPARAEPLE